MAEMQPPMFHIHPMRVLFMIPSHPPPVLQIPSPHKVKSPVSSSGTESSLGLLSSLSMEEDVDDWSYDFISFLKTCLQKDPNERPTAQELLKHPFLKVCDSDGVVKRLIERARERKRKRKELMESEDDTQDGENVLDFDEEISLEQGTVKGPEASSTSPTKPDLPEQKEKPITTPSEPTLAETSTVKRVVKVHSDASVFMGTKGEERTEVVRGRTIMIRPIPQNGTLSKIVPETGSDASSLRQESISRKDEQSEKMDTPDQNGDETKPVFRAERICRTNLYIHCCANVDSVLLFGCEDGLFAYTRDEDESGKLLPLSNRRYHQIEYIPSLRLCLSRSGKYDIITLHDLAEFQPR
jgi:serine/threonine protein kinase